jgi:hypothetical protein
MLEVCVLPIVETVAAGEIDAEVKRSKPEAALAVSETPHIAMLGRNTAV